MMRKFTFPAIAALAAAAAVFAVSALRADGGDSQTFTPARYALLTGSVDVSLLQPGPGDGSGGCRRDVVLKIDTLTGDVWVLQLGVNGVTDPSVRSAAWAHVANRGAFSPFGSSDQQQNDGSGDD